MISALLGFMLGLILFALQIPVMAAKASLIATHKIRKKKREKSEDAEKNKEKSSDGTNKSKRQPKTKLGRKLSHLKSRFRRDDKKGKSNKIQDKGAEVADKSKKAVKKKIRGVVRETSYLALKASLTTILTVLRFLAILAPVLGAFVAVIALILIFTITSSTSFYSSSSSEGGWHSQQQGYLGYQGAETTIVLKDGRSVLEFLRSNSGTYGPLSSEADGFGGKYTAGNQFTSFNVCATWYLDHVATFSNVSTGEEIYCDTSVTVNTLDFWSNTLEFHPRRWYGQSVALGELNSYLSSYNSQARSHYDWTPTGDQTESDRPAMPTWNFSQPDKNKFKQDVDPKSPVKYEATVNVVTGKNGKTSSQKKTYYDYIIDDANLDGQRFVLNSLYKKDFDKINDKSDTRTATFKDTDGEDHLRYSGAVDGIENSLGFSNNEGFLDFYTSALSQGTGTIHFADIKGKNGDEIKATQITGWSVRLISSVDDLQFATYGDILYSGNEYSIFLALDNSSRQVFTWNWDTIRTSFPDYGRIVINGSDQPNDSRVFYALFHYAGTTGCPAVDDFKAGIAVQLTTGTTASAVGVAALSMTGVQPVSPDLSDWTRIQNSGASSSMARRAGLVKQEANGRYTSIVTAVGKTRYSSVTTHQLEDGCPTSGSTSWINTIADKNYQAFSGIYSYTPMEPISCTKALSTFYMDMNYDYSQTFYPTEDIKNVFPTIKHFRTDCSGYVGAYIELMTEGHYPNLGENYIYTSIMYDKAESAINNGNGRWDLGDGYYIQWQRTADWTSKDAFKSVPIGSIYLKDGHTGVYIGYKEIEGVTYTLCAGWGRRFGGYPVTQDTTGVDKDSVFWWGTTDYVFVGTICKS